MNRRNINESIITSNNKEINITIKKQPQKEIKPKENDTIKSLFDTSEDSEESKQEKDSRKRKYPLINPNQPSLKSNL